MNAPTDPSAELVEWFRADSWPRMRRVLIGGPALLSFGGLVVAVQFVTRAPPGVRALSAALGLALVASGAAFTLLAMQRILRDDTYLAIRTDGLVYRSAGQVKDPGDPEETRIAWDDLARARWDEGRAVLVLEPVTGQPLVIAHPFARIAGPELAERIERSRRRASMGLPC
jgi:hypothetical protein